MTSTTAHPVDPDGATKAHLLHYLRQARDTLIWKLDGLSEYDLRRPLTPTGTNLLGLVKHATLVEHDYFGVVFDQPVEPLSWTFHEDEPNVDMWATAEQSSRDLVAEYRRVGEHSDAVIERLPLETPGRVPWWAPERAEVTLHRIAVHTIVDLQRHAGHADILRELIDGAVALRTPGDNLPSTDADWWADYRRRLEDVARGFIAD
ncbi:DinB family protein [Streptomyces triticirhizae]|uniref:DinB family protein n=1 Tax=Streptomyces triticirhizae TaxID=2483353 RepID=A0A3M2LR85_9ACTN|nr:DinB family protein [Streptomyces triticirhizae]RMI39606.1 DinB family protein [Streptomyces triticirhizae]